MSLKSALQSILIVGIFIVVPGQFCNEQAGPVAQGVLGRIQSAKVRSAAEGRGGEADNGRLPSLCRRRQGKGNKGGVRQVGRESERGGGHHEVCGTSRLLALAGHHSKWSTMWGCRQPHSRGVPQWCPPLGGFMDHAPHKDPPPQNVCWWSCEADVGRAVKADG